jgi:hypothetical protein
MLTAGTKSSLEMVLAKKSDRSNLALLMKKETKNRLFYISPTN